MAATTIGIHRLAHAKDMAIPTRASEGSVGFDIRACINDTLIVKANSSQLIPCGFALKLPPNFYAIIRSRSGLALKSGVLVLHGLIDNDFTGEICVVLFNLNNTPFIVHRGDRIAQIVFQKWEAVVLTEVLEFTESNSLSTTQVLHLLENPLTATHQHNAVHMHTPTAP